MKSNKIKIVLADDHRMMIDGLRSMLSDEKDLEVVGVAYNGKEALEAVLKHNADVLITDYNMPEMNGLELTEALQKVKPDVKILVLTMYGDITHIEEMLQAGISGYILKNTGNDELINAIHKLHNGGTYYDDEVAQEIFRSLKDNSIKKQNVEKVNLTDREKEIIQLISQEHNNAMIGDMLSISERTVESHRKNIYRKTNTNTIIGLLKFAFANGLVK